MGKIFFVLGKSCSGKDTIFKLLKENSDLDLRIVVGYTTRPMRAEEKDGVEYFFVEQEQLRKMKEENKVIECRGYNTVHGLWNYFTADDGQINLEEGNYLYIGTLESFVKMRDYFGKESVIPIYIEVETGQRLARAVEREIGQSSPKYAELCRRFLADEEDFSEDKIRDAGIEKRYENVLLEQCVRNIENDIKSYL